MTNELKHYGVIGMKWGTRLSKEVRGVKKAYRRDSFNRWKEYNKRVNNFAPEMNKKYLDYWDRLNRAEASDDKDKKRLIKKFTKEKLELEKELSNGYDKLAKDYSKLVKKSKKQYGKDLVDARLKAYNRLYRKPFGRSELKHYGILGMKWGKRKAKTSTSSNPPKSSKHYDSLVSKYSQKGYSPQEASRRAKNRIRAEKTLLAVGGTALAAAGAYVAYKKYVKDTVLPSSTQFERYGDEHLTGKLKDSFVYKKHDKIGGEYGDAKVSQLWAKYGDSTGIYKAKFEQGTKVASPKHARDAFVKEFKEDKRFREHLSKAIKDMEIGGKINTPERRKAVNDLNKALQGKKKFLRGSVYDGFTTVIKDNNTHSTNANLDYFSALSRKGINAVVDRDSKKLASIKAKSPILREHGHGANRFGFGFESLKDDSLIGIFDRQLARNRKRRK